MRIKPNLKVYLKWLLLFPVDLLVTLSAYPMAPIVALLSLKWDMSKSWYCTWDNPIDGEEFYVKRYPGNKWYQKLKRRTYWMWRNKAYNFSYKYTSVTQKPGDFVDVDWNITDKSKAPWVEKNWACTNNSFKLYWIIPYKFTKKRCLRIYIGWKIRSHDVDEPYKAMYVMAINPFKPMRDNPSKGGYI